VHGPTSTLVLPLDMGETEGQVWSEAKAATVVSMLYVTLQKGRHFVLVKFHENSNTALGATTRVKWRMAIRKVSPKKGVALLLSINVGLILFRKFSES
jgi:hypothetical protein